MAAENRPPIVPSRPRGFAWGLMAAFFFLSIAIGVAGFLYLRYQTTQFREAAWKELSAIADLKADQIGNWYGERRADAEMIFETPAIYARFRQFLADPVPKSVGPEFLGWMEAVRKRSALRRLVLFDGRGVLRLAVPSDGRASEYPTQKEIQVALASQGVVAADLHLAESPSESGQRAVYLTFFVPIRARPGADGPAEGVLAMQIDPYQFLYSLVQNWPTPSTTAETLLVRREGDEVVFLNKPRHRGKTALSFRLPIDREPRLAAAMAAKGHEGVVEGPDYRGVPVLGAVRAVPGTSWFLMAKVDREEIFSPLRERAWVTGVLVLILILAAALAVALLWRQRSLEAYREEIARHKEHEREIDRMNRLYAALSQVNQAIVRVKTRKELFEEVCRVLVEFGRFRMAWVGWFDPETRAVEPVAQYGDERDYLKEIRVIAADRREGRGPTGSAIGEGRAVIIGDIAGDPRMEPWREAALRHGFASSASIPIRLGGVLRGALSIYAAESAWFGGKEMALLEEVAADISFALDYLEGESNRRRAEASLCESEARLSFALEGANEGLWDVQRKTGEVYLSPRGCEILGYGPEELSGVVKVWRDLVHPDDLPQTMERFNAHVDGRAPFIDVEQRLRTKTGGWKWTHTRGKVVARDGQGNPLRVTGTYVDISQRKQTEEALRRAHGDLERRVAERTSELAVAKERAEDADRLKSVFLAAMSHELRTPLNSIIGFTGILLQGLAGPLNPEQSKQLGMVRSSAHHLLALINDVLDLSKIEAGQLDVLLEAFDLRGSIEKVVSAVAPFAEKKGFGLAVEVAADVGGVVSDRRRVEQVTINLLNNAIKFTERGEVRLTARAEAGPATDGGGGAFASGPSMIRIAVSDTGIGIRPEHLKELFRPFRQIETGLARQHEGTGLGLAICRRLAGLLGGTVHAESEWGQGSTFTFSFPSKGPVEP